MGTADKREFSRVEIQINAIITAEGRSPVQGKLHDVSLNGVCIECDSDLETGEACNIDIELGSDEAPVTIHAEGEVSRKLGDSLAISFTGLDSEGFPHLQNLVLYNAGNTEDVEKEFSEHFGIKPKTHS